MKTVHVHAASNQKPLRIEIGPALDLRDAAHISNVIDVTGEAKALAWALLNRLPSAVWHVFQEQVVALKEANTNAELDALTPYPEKFIVP